MRFKLIPPVLLGILVSGCGQSLDAYWTLEGEEPNQELCDRYGADTITVDAFPADSSLEVSQASFPCKDGTGSLELSGEIDQVIFSLLRSDVVIGNDVAELNGGVAVGDVSLTHGTLTLAFTGSGSDLCSLNPGGVDVVLSQRTQGIESVEIDRKNIGCVDGVATYKSVPVRIGNEFVVYAETIIDGSRWRTPLPGTAVRVDTYATFQELLLRKE